MERPLLEVQSLSAAYGRITVLRDISLRVNPGETVTILGANGAGKTTLFKAILNLVNVTQGDVFFDGHRITGMKTHDIQSLGIGVVPEGKRLFPKMTVLENLRMGAHRVKDEAVIRERIDEMMERFPRLRERATQLAGTMFGVQIRNQMDRLDIQAVFQGTSGIMNEEYNQALDQRVAEGSIGVLDGLPLQKLPGGPEFLEHYNAAGFSDPPEAYGPFAYVATQLIIQAVEEVGPNRRTVTNYLNSEIKNVDTIIGPVNFDEHGQNDVPLASVYVSQDGRWVPWEDSRYADGSVKLPGKP